MSRSRTGDLRIALPLLAILASACADRITPAETSSDPPELAADGERPDFALLECRAAIADGTIDCAPPSPQVGEGIALDQRVVGGQGVYVRLSSSEVAYVDGIFSFDATIRNLADAPMATADGSSRDEKGVRVFFQQAPTATSGSGEITVANPTGVGLFTGSDQAYFQYGGALEGEDQAELGADGILDSGEVSEAKRWELEVPASVESFAFTVLVATEMAPGDLNSAAPAIIDISPAVLIPGNTATISGVRFSTASGGNVVTIGGVNATVTSATTTELEVDVPCLASGNVPVAVTTGVLAGAPRYHPVQAAVQTVGVGEMVVIDSPSAIACSELPAVGGEARYLVSMFSNSTAPTSNSPARIRGRGASGALSADPAPRGGGTLISPDVPFEQFAELARQQLADEQHARILEENNRVLREFGGRMQRSGDGAARDGAVLADVSPNRTFRVPNINVSNFCANYYVVSATRVYYDGKVAIYEDDATPEYFKAANSAAMATYYQQIGDQFNEDMEPVVREYFGDVLRRDAVTDNNGVILVLFTPRINTSFSGVAGFVVSCDLLPNDDANTPGVGGPYASSPGSSLGSSNHGEIFYAYQPVVNGTGYSANTPDNWYRTIRSTFIHETKHLASYVARAENGAPFEAAWLEEGTARHSEELWARRAVDPQPWKGNLGYGSEDNPVNIFCDARPGDADCNVNPRRPASIMQRHFASLYTHLNATNARLLSPFGATVTDNASYYYAISWSLVRYAADRYAVDEAAFFRALTGASETGVANLLARTGATLDDLLAGWTLALAADDHPLWETQPSADVQIATWNLRDVYRGFNTDFPGTYVREYPQIPAPLGFGDFTGASATTLRGGGALWYELSGEQVAPQLLWLEASGGGPAPSTVRMAITRIE